LYIYFLLNVRIPAALAGMLLMQMNGG
jgi:hypothetical protein